MKRIIIILLALFVVLAFLFWKFGPNIGGPLQPKEVTLTYWGLWEEDNLIKPVIAEYQKTHPNVTINYVRQSSVNYRTRAQTQIRAGTGPDVFRIHNSWLPMFTGDLTPAPSDIFSLSSYQSTFYPVAKDAFVSGNNIFAAPIEVDGLAMFYNEEILTAAGVAIPKNWQDFVDAAVKTTVKDSTGVIRSAGAAMGTASNVDSWSDIIGLLLLQQPGVDLKNGNVATPVVAEVIRFYTGFVLDPKKKTWDVSLPSSTQAFAQNQLTFYFGPSWKAFELRQLNPDLKFKVAAVPQLSSNATAWASFWGEAVSAKSQNPKEAWEFVKFLTSPEAQKLAYNQASQIRLYGEPYSRVDLAAELVGDPLVGAYVTQGPIYKFWYLSSNTFDAGINDEMIKYFEDGINATLSGTDPQIALQTVDRGVKQVLNKYTKPQVAPQR